MEFHRPCHKSSITRDGSQLHAACFLSHREEERGAFLPLASSSCIGRDLSYASLPLKKGDVTRNDMLGGAWSFNNWTCAAVGCDERKKTKAGLGSTLEVRGRGFRARLRVGGSTAAAITVRLQRAYNPRIDPRRHRPSNLLSAQFQRTMEFTARRYAALLSALRLAARLMRLRLPTGGGRRVASKPRCCFWQTRPHCTTRLWRTGYRL